MKRWFVLSSEPQDLMDCYELMDDVLIHHGQMDADTLKKEAGETPLVVLITSHHWSCVGLTLPKIKPSLLREALPHMIEDSTISAAEALHCVLPHTYKPGEPTTVLLLSQAWMQCWVDWIKAFSLNVQAIIPAYTVLPIIDGQISAICYEDFVWIRYAELEGYCLPKTLVKVLGHKMVSAAELNVFGDVDELRTLTDAKIHPQMMRLQDCLQQIESFPINFLQGNFKPKKQRQPLKLNAMTLNAGLLTLALLIHLGYLLASHLVLTSKLATLQAQSLVLYQEVYPEATAVSSPKALISRLLEEQHIAGDQGFYDLLDHLSQTLQTYPLKVSQLSYQEHRMMVTGTVNNFESLERLTQHLHSLGYAIEQQSAQKTNDTIEVSLLIFRGQS